MPTRFASSIDGAPILAARAYADQYGVNIDQYYAKKTELFSGDYNDLSNKPDLSVYALASSLATVATSGSYNDLSDKPTIPPAQVQSDWNQTNSSAVDYIKNKPTLFSGDYNDLTNKPDLSVYALSSSLATVATSGDYNDLSNKPTIPAAQVNSDWNAVSGVAQILNKPDLSVYALSSSLATVATSGDYNDLTNKPTIPAAQIQSDWSQTNTSALDYIKNKPDLSVYALASSLASVATSGDYNDLTNKPSIPAAQVQSDYAQTDSSAVDYIKNKPDLSVYALSSSLATVATSGDYNDLSNKPTIPTKTSDLTNDSGFITVSQVPAQVQSNWNESDNTSPAYIQNKPDLSVYALSSSLATVATSGSYNDLSDKPTIPAAQVQSNWTEADTTDPSYIQNKPTQIGLAAGTNINFVEDNVNNILTINATAAPQQQANWSQSDSSAVDYIQNKPDLSVYALATDLPTFVEGQNVHISTSGTNVTISADDTTYTAGTGIDITNDVISVDTDDVKIDYWHGGSNSALASGNNLNANVSATAYRGTNIYVSGGAITLKPGTYAVNAFVKVNNTNTTLDDDAYKLSFSGGITGGNPTIAYNFDNSFRHEEVVEVSFLTVNLGSTDAALVLTTDALSVLSGVSVTLTYAQVYCLSGIVGASGSGGGGSAVITLSSNDHSVTINESTIGDVKNFDLSVPAQVNADWNSSSGKSQILNKPDLSVYALSANLATVATSGSYNDLSDKPTIPQAPVQSNWTESNSSSLAYILNKPDLTAYALKSELATVATSGSYADLSNKPSIPTVDQVYDGTSVNAQSGAAMAGALASKQDNMVVLEYGTSTWNDFITAYNKNAILYCRVLTNTNQYRLAHLSYLNLNSDGVSTNIPRAEFWFVRSIGTHNGSNQCDEVIIYTLYGSNDTWETTTRKMCLQGIAGDGVARTVTQSAGAGTISWSVKAATNGGITVDSNGVSADVKEAPSDGKEYVRKNGAWVESSGAVETVLWSDSNGSNAASITLSESPSNFEKIIVVINDVYGYGSAATVNQVIMTPSESRYTYSASYIFSAGTEVITRGCSIRASTNTATSWDTSFWAVGITTSGGITCSVSASQIRLMKIIGINRITNAS